MVKAVRKFGQRKVNDGGKLCGLVNFGTSVR